MGDVIKFAPRKARREPTARKAASKEKAARKEKANGRTLCGRGFHHWVIESRKQFDVKQGCLVTLHRCDRCGKTKTSLT